MDRRKVIVSAGLGITLIGYLKTRHYGGIDTPIPSELEGLRFERIEQNESAVDPGTDPIIQVSSDERQVTIEGNPYVGSTECHQAKLNSISMDNSVLRFEVTPGKSPHHPRYSLINFGCSEVLAADSYQLNSPIPAGIDQIEVIERNHEGRTRVVSVEVE